MPLVPEGRRSRRQKGDPRRDVRAADLQEEPTKRVETRVDLQHSHLVGSDDDGGFQRTSQRAMRAIRQSERSEWSNRVRIARRRA
jgi:hypothetical protein